MLATSGAFAAMVTGGDQMLAWRVTMTLPGGAYSDMTLAVSSVQIDASTTSDMPAGTRLQVGYPSMQARFTLSGLVDQTDESKTAAWLFGRYSTTSPLYQLDALFSAVTVDLGLYPAAAAGTPEYVRKFTGIIDDYVANPDGTVSFTCIDLIRSWLRSAPALPSIGSVAAFETLTAEYAVDALLRAATDGAVSSWPAQRPGCVMAAGLRSVLQAEVGQLTITLPPPAWTFVPGVFGTALQPSVAFTGRPVWTWSAPVVMAPSSTTTLHVETWVNNLNDGVLIWLYDAHSALVAQVQFDGSSLITAIVTKGSGSPASVAASTSPGGHYFAADITITINGAGVATWGGTAYIGATSYSLGTGHTAFTSAVPVQMDSVLVDRVGSGAVSFEALQVSVETTPASNFGFTPRAVLDPSLNALSVIPESAAGDPYRVIQQICDAELAVAGGDESGIFRFYNRDTIRGATSARDITSSGSLTAIGGVETTAAAVVNRAIVDYTDWNYAAARTAVYSATAPIKVPAHQTIILTPTLDNPVTDVPGIYAAALPDGSTDQTASYYRASIDSAGTARHPGVYVLAAQSGANTLRITLYNPSSLDAWLVSPANYLDLTVGTPVLRIAGIAITASAVLTADYQYPPVNPDGTGGAKTTRFGEVANQISGNPWIQDRVTAEDLTTAMVVDLANPRPNLTAVSIIPDPRLQLIDVAHIQDPDVTLVDEYGRIFGWTITWEAGSAGSADRYEMTVDARTLAAPGGWLMGVAGRSEIPTTAYVYPSI